MPVTILIPTALRSYADGLAAVHVEGRTVGEALGALAARHSALQKQLRTGDGRLRSFVNVYLNEEDIRYLQQEDTALRDGDKLTIVPSIAGGSGNGAATQAASRPLPLLDNDEIARYSRHLILPEVGMDGQRKLKGGSVLCVGAGGLGSPLTLYLAAAGVGRIGIVDFDVVDASNLQRQILHGTSWLGKSKLESAKQRLLDLNPKIQVDTYEEPLSSANALRIFRDYDVVADGTDNFPTRYLVNDACVLLGKPNAYGSIFRFEGQASVFHWNGGPCYRCLYPEPPPPGLVPSCAEGGVLGILPGIIGVIQATEAVKIILGVGETLSGRLLLYDALGMGFRELRLRRDPHCVLCSANATQKELIDYEQFCGVPGREHEEHTAQPAGTAGAGAAGAAAAPAAEGFTRLSVQQIAARMKEGWKPFILDVRKPHEANIVKLDSDLLIPHEEVAQHVNELPKDRDILVHCKLGGRSSAACKSLSEKGFSRLFNMEGGITAWAKEIDSRLPTY
jgi:adenylyltransferase/sulfurtransferase